MDSLESTLRSKILTIVEKLQKLECTLLGNRDDAWIMELLFKPGFHRYHLIEWMLSKLGYDIGKMSGPQNSAEERMKNLQSTLAGLGICRENINDVIKGTAEVKEQLEFWCQFTDIIWLKHQIAIDTSSRTDEGVALSPDKNKGKHDEFEDAASCINKLCESVNLNHLFRNELDLLPPDVLREIENLSPSKELCSIPTLEEMQESIKDNPSINLKDLQKALSYDNNVSYDKNENDDILELNKLEERMSDLCSDLKTSAETSFSDVYNDLKPLIHHAKSDTFTDDGPAFQKLETPLDNMLQLKNSFAKLESSYSKLLTINSNLEDVLNQDSFSDENYVNILKLVKGELD